MYLHASYILTVSLQHKRRSVPNKLWQAFIILMKKLAIINGHKAQTI